MTTDRAAEPILFVTIWFGRMIAGVPRFNAANRAFQTSNAGCFCPAMEWDGDDTRCQCCGGVFKCYHALTLPPVVLCDDAACDCRRELCMKSECPDLERALGVGL